MLAHIAGIPVEEVILPLAGSGIGAGVLVLLASVAWRPRRGPAADVRRRTPH